MTSIYTVNNVEYISHSMEGGISIWIYTKYDFHIEHQWTDTSMKFASKYKYTQIKKQNKMYFKTLSARYQPFRCGINVLKIKHMNITIFHATCCT